ncbi:chemotaxis protein CheW [Sporosarcina trichiuri]|uniref:chemotaxis protein CheW n=1 Tax=Sporosarcina trichiuri TaxID=3056445 RepID=UPI0025B3684A|nr:CheW domain-containing protein [Sporosarcina sp. 0.2-SM1T-5]WJY28404.1 CheW domain-containing protein [Sporosarcina sp. 0.2-SM1T-5]
MEDFKAIVVRCGNEEYALPVEKTVSIEELEKINPIPHLPDYLLGLMRIRGELVPILDFQQILYNTSAKDEPDAKVVVVQTGDFFYGLLVLEAKEILDIPADRLTTQGLMAYSRTPYFSSVANLEDRIITVIDPRVLTETLSGMQDIADYVHSREANVK